MRLLNVALAGLLGLAGLVAGAKNGKDYTYLHNGIEVRGEATAQANCENDDAARTKCICDGLDIQRCDYEGSACFFVEHCPKGCFYTGHGTVCVDRAPVSARDEGISAGLEQAQSKCDGVKEECRECTRTRRGVYTCIEGFCSVQPKDWCKSGWSCRDDCDCCKKDRKRDARAIEASDNTVEVREIPDGEFMIPNYVLDETYGSCEHDAWGHLSCRANNSVIVVCDPADSQWRGVGKCVGGEYCCESRRDNPNSAQCKC